MKRVILETPYKGKDWLNTKENIRFARLCMRDCLTRGEAPYASHLLYTQEGVLDDKIVGERKLGMEAGFEWKSVGDSSVVYINRGISIGVQLGIRKSITLGQKFEYRKLSEYKHKLPTPIIATISGASGAGKTSIIRKMLDRCPDLKFVRSFTTRSPRSSDLLGEYSCNFPTGLFEKNSSGFLWVLSVHGNLYGTRKRSISEILTPCRFSLAPRVMVIMPEAIPLLRHYISGFENYIDSLISFYILSPGEEELWRRLRARGDDESSIKMRIEECKQWDARALQSDIPYIFLSNGGSPLGVEHIVEQMSLFF